MLTTDAINALLRAGESETLELKERFGADVVETAVAFANTHGGTILIGVRADAGLRIFFRQTREGRQTADQVTPQVTPQVTELLHALVGESTRDSLMGQLGLKDREHFRTGYLAPAMGAGLVEMTLPDKPTSRLQKYRLTVAGRQMQAVLLAERSAQGAKGDRAP